MSIENPLIQHGPVLGGQISSYAASSTLSLEAAEKVPFQAAMERASVYLKGPSRPLESHSCSGAIPRKEASSTRRFMTA